MTVKVCSLPSWHIHGMCTPSWHACFGRRSSRRRLSWPIHALLIPIPCHSVPKFLEKQLFSILREIQNYFIYRIGGKFKSWNLELGRAKYEVAFWSDLAGKFRIQWIFIWQFWSYLSQCFANLRLHCARESQSVCLFNGAAAGMTCKRWLVFRIFSPHYSSYVDKTRRYFSYAVGAFCWIMRAIFAHFKSQRNGLDLPFITSGAGS